MRCAVWLTAAGVALPAASEVYRYTDAAGNLHFTQQLDRVPRDQREKALRDAKAGSGGNLQTYRSGRGSAAPPARRAPSRGGELHIPFTRAGTLMQVNAVLNGHLTVPFLIDTGASGVSLPARYADALGLRVDADTPRVSVVTANGTVSLPLVKVGSIELSGARVDNLHATLNPSMDFGLLGGSFFNNFIYRVDAAKGVISLSPNDGMRGGLDSEQWRQRFQLLRDPLERLEAHLRDHPKLRVGERAALEQRLATLQERLEELESEANRFDVPQIWRD